MPNIKYLVKRVMKMDYKNMLDKISRIHKETGRGRIAIFNDMRKCAVKYGAGYSDYDLFEMYRLTDEERDTYITRGRNNDLVIKYNDVNYYHIFNNKSEFDFYFKDFIKRDFIDVNSSKKEDVIKFMKKHSVFMAKPVVGTCGKGIEKIDVHNYASLDDIYGYLSREGVNYVLEEIIQQHPKVSSIYPDSINTVRIVTIVDDEGEPHVICAYFRIGNGKYVDNFNSGGMVTPVNEETGEVLDKALDKKKNLYECHPVTKTTIKGFLFPDWNKAIELVKKASKVVPEMRYIGWDVCFTPDGPILVEGNEFPGHDLYQLPAHTPNHIGLWPKFTKFFTK